MALTKAHNRMIQGSSISVVDYGADASGSTDSTSAIQAALDYGLANEVSVYFPAGNYITSSPLALTDVGIVLFANNDATITSTATGAIFDLTSPDPATRGYYDKVIIEGITFVGDGANTTHGIKLYGASYANCEIRNCFVQGATQYMVYLEQCWAIDIINCQLGFGAVSRTTSGTVGIRVTNANAVMIRDSIITSMGLNYDGIGVSISSAEASSIENCTIENMQTGIDVTQASGPITIAQNYFECSSTVQGLRDVTEPWIKVGSSSTVTAAIVRENWFLIGNSARNIRFYDAQKCVFSDNTHNPGFAQDSYYIIDNGCLNIEIKNNSRIFPITSALDASANATTEAIASKADNPAQFIGPEGFISALGSPSLALTNGVPAWLLDASTDEAVATVFAIPSAWGECTVKVSMYLGSTATSGDASVSADPVAVSADGSTAITTNADSRIFTVSATANSVTQLNYGNWEADVEAGDFVTILAKRTGTDTNDTLTADLAFYGVRVERIIQ